MFFQPNELFMQSIRNCKAEIPTRAKAGECRPGDIEVEFIGKLRDEIKFESLEALTAQMNIDAARAREILSKVESG